MALTQTQVSELYVAIFGRVSEGSGNKAWQNSGLGAEEAAQKMLATEPAKEYFKSSLDSNEAFVKHIYLNTLNKTQVEDPDGIKNWVDHLNSGKSREWVITKLIESAKDPVHKTLPSKDAHQFFLNKVALSDYTADKVDGKDLKVEDLTPFKDALKLVTSDPDSLVAAKQYVDALAGTPSDTSVEWNSKPAAPAGAEVALTTSDDKATANVFNAGMGWNPGGTDRMMTLQSEDKLVGDSTRADNTLNVTFGKQNGDEKDPFTRTPDLKNIQNINIEVTGDVHTLDLRNSDDVEKVSIDRITAEADAGKKFTVQSIGEKLHGIRVKDSAKKDAEIKFEHKDGVLNGLEDKTSLFLDNSVAAKVTVNDEDGNDGYEKIDLVSKGSVKIGELNLVDLQNIDIKGSGSLTLADVKRDDANQFDKVTKAGLAVDNPEFFKSLDASGFAGKLAIDITDIVGAEHVDPSGSGKDTVATIKGSGLGDTFYVVGGEIKARNIIDGGASGEDKLVLIDSGIATENAKNEIARVRNVETLELRAQTGTGATVDFDAFTDEDGKAETSIRKVVVRDENYAALAQFTFNDVTKDFADNGRFVIEHAAAKSEEPGNNTELTVNLKDTKAADDKITVEIVNSSNLDKSFGYKINAKGIENINLIDKDTENNSVELVTTGAKNSDSTITLSEGVAKQTYEITGVAGAQIAAATVDGSAYIGDIRLTVGRDNAEGAQTIKLGKGDDILTFGAIGNLNNEDKISDAGGEDILRAVFDKDTVLDVAGTIENLHIAGNTTLTLDISKAGAKNLVFMSSEAVAQEDRALNDAVKGMGLANTINNAGIVTIDKSTLAEINFSGDLVAKDKTDDAVAAGVAEKLNQVFNGVELKDNKEKSVTININAALDNGRTYINEGPDSTPNTGDDFEKTIEAADGYSVGKVTVHGAENIDIKVADDRSKNDLKGIKATNTVINNIASKDLKTLKVASKGDVDLKFVTSNGANNSITLIDAKGVVGDFKADVAGLGDNSEVFMADGNNVFSAISSAGKGIKINAGNGNNDITGSAQSDYITVGDGDNKIYADEGDNVVTVGNGNDHVEAKYGSDTVVFGEGNDFFEDNKGTSIKQDNTVTTVTKQFGAASIQSSTNGDGVFTDWTSGVKADDIAQWIAVGKGSELKFQWVGGELKAPSISLDNSRAFNYDDATKDFKKASTLTQSGDKNANLWVVDNMDGNLDIAGNEGNDVVIITDRQAGQTLKFTGGQGNDAAVGGIGEDTFIGGDGADVFVTFNNASLATDGKRDTIEIKDGESLVGSHDVVYGFDLTNLTGDTLKLASTKVAADEPAGNGDDFGVVKAHKITTGIVEFFKDDAGTENISTIRTGGNDFNAVTEKTLKNALDYISKVLEGTGNTVAFRYDADGDKDTINDQSIFVYQDGAKDTLVELVGSTNFKDNSLKLAAADADHTIFIS